MYKRRGCSTAAQKLRRLSLGSQGRFEKDHGLKADLKKATASRPEGQACQLQSPVGSWGRPILTELKVIVSSNVYGVLGHCDPRGCIPLRGGEARAWELALAETACRQSLRLRQHGYGFAAAVVVAVVGLKGVRPRRFLQNG